jgi:hypothetical protein
MVNYEDFFRSPRVTGALLIALIIAVTIILQLLKWVDVLANMTDLWLFVVALPILSIGFALLTRSPTKSAPTTIPTEPQAIPKRKELWRSLDEIAILEEAQAYFPSTTSTVSISNLKKIKHQTVLEICRGLGTRELLEVKEMNGVALVRITARGQKVLKEAVD